MNKQKAEEQPLFKVMMESGIQGWGNMRLAQQSMRQEIRKGRKKRKVGRGLLVPVLVSWAIMLTLRTFHSVVWCMRASALLQGLLCPRSAYL